MLKLTVYNYWRDANNYQQEKTHLFNKIIYFSVQFQLNWTYLLWKHNLILLLRMI